MLYRFRVRSYGVLGVIERDFRDCMTEALEQTCNDLWRWGVSRLVINDIDEGRVVEVLGKEEIASKVSELVKVADSLL